MELDRGIVLTPEMVEAMDCDAIAVYHDAGKQLINVQVMARGEIIGAVAITEAEYADQEQDLGELVCQRFGGDPESVADIGDIMEQSLNENID